MIILLIKMENNLVNFLACSELNYKPKYNVVAENNFRLNVFNEKKNLNTIAYKHVF